MRLSVTREDYFEAAMKLLAAEGAAALKMTTLCRALSVTTGSFYGYFGSFAGFVGDFLAYWEETQTARLAELANAPTDPAQRVHSLKDLATDLPHDAESAIRGWAHFNAQVAEAQKRVDQRRQETIVTLIQPEVGSRCEATKVALFGLSLLIGLQQCRSSVTRRDYYAVFSEYERILVSRMADPADR